MERRNEDPRIQEVIHHLRLVIKGRGLSMRELDRQVGWNEGYVSHLLNGHMDLKLKHIFEILDAVDVLYSEFFARCEPQAVAQAAAKDQRLLSDAVAAVDRAEAQLRDVKRQIAAVVHRQELMTAAEAD